MDDGIICPKCNSTPHVDNCEWTKDNLLTEIATLQARNEKLEGAALDLISNSYAPENTFDRKRWDVLKALLPQENE